ncbi:hypothetical protein V1478_016415 [Vespula squamosa]|uniref:Uncharacterized protein n=1 Tax=Vespula squamosa TaxID=30214 RepID=A0ABD1ZZT5_VESSQ
MQNIPTKHLKLMLLMNPYLYHGNLLYILCAIFTICTGFCDDVKFMNVKKISDNIVIHYFFSEK